MQNYVLPYRSHSNRHPCPSRCPPASTIKLLAHKNGWNWWFLYKKYMDQWRTVLTFASILLNDNIFEVRFQAYQYMPALCLAHSQCATLWMNTIHVHLQINTRPQISIASDLENNIQDTAVKSSSQQIWLNSSVKFRWEMTFHIAGFLQALSILSIIAPKICLDFT